MLAFSFEFTNPFLLTTIYTSSPLNSPAKINKILTKKLACSESRTGHSPLLSIHHFARFQANSGGQETQFSPAVAPVLRSDSKEGPAKAGYTLG